MLFVVSGCATVDQSVFVGKYSERQQESRSDLFLLDNNTFCYTFMGGSLNIVTAGSWTTSNEEKNTVVLKERESDKNIHPAQGQQLNRLDNKISIVVDGYSIADINSAVFAISKDETPPSKFRPLLPKHNNTGRAYYSFPLFIPDDTKYFYVGSLEKNPNNEANRLQVTQYKIGNNDTIRIAFNNLRNRLPTPFNAQLIDNSLQLNGQHFSQKTELNQQEQQTVSKYCVAQEPLPKSNQKELEWTTLTRNKTLYFSEESITNKPYFNKNDNKEARKSNGLNALVKDEKNLLEQQYNKANQDITTYNEFLTTAEKLLKIEQRQSIYIKDISIKSAQLLVNTIAHGKVKAAEQLFNAYVTTIYPLIKESTNKQVQYSVLVIASQGTILYGATRDKAILTTVLDTLLGSDFNIETTNNATLAYNLACIHSLNRNKPDMLKAIKAARKMNKTTELFMKDGDFAFYRTDKDFLASIR